MIVTRTGAFTDYLSWLTTGGHWTTDVLPVINRKMTEDVDHAKGDGRGRLRPSLIGHPCDRVQLLSYRYAKASSTEWRAWLGTWMHLAFDTYLLDRWPHRLMVEYPIRSADRVGVTGKADWYWFTDGESALMSRIHGHHLGDYKTLERITQIDDGPLPKHIAQLQYECYTTKVRNAYLVYQVRGYGTMAAYHLQMTRDDDQECADRLSRLGTYIDSGTLPPMLTECRARKGLFRSCDFADICVEQAVAGH